MRRIGAYVVLFFLGYFLMMVARAIASGVVNDFLGIGLLVLFTVLLILEVIVMLRRQRI